MYKKQNINTHRPITTLLGGTFDPVHNGHIAIAEHLLATYPTNQVELLPNATPPHKTSLASPQQRLDMLNLAIKNHPQLSINLCELNNNGPNYTIDTLQSLSATLKNTTLCFAMGMDSFNQMDSWKNYRDILTYCHLIIYQRKNTTINNDPWQTALLDKHESNDNTSILCAPTGQIFIDPYIPPDISSTALRQALSINTSLSPVELNQSVFDYIQKHAIYRTS